MSIRARRWTRLSLEAIRARSLVLPQIAEALLTESEATASRIERRLERFLSKPMIDVEQMWEARSSR